MIVTPLIDLRYGNDDLQLLDTLEVFSYFESVYGAASYNIQAVDEGWDKWNKILTDDRESPASLRFGWGIDGESAFSERKSVLINSADLHMESFGKLSVDINGTCRGFHLLERQHRDQLAFRNMRISDMVVEIANRNDLESDITPTKGRFTFYQCALSDFDFVRKILLEQAVSQEGFADYHFYIRDGSTLVFKIPNIGEKADIVFEWFLGNSGDLPAEVQDFTVIYRRKFMANSASLKTEVRGYDPKEKKKAFFTADSESVPYRKLVRGAHLPPSQISNVKIVAAPPPEDMRQDYFSDYGKALWMKNARSLFRAVLETSPQPHAKVGTILDIVIKSPFSRVAVKDHFASGRYFVYALENKQTDTLGTTTFYLERRSFNQ